MTFAKGLRAILRQDPDVVMVGEIRDYETAEIAIQASLTGHLVLSTLHTNTAVGAITRLKDIGIEPFLLASSLIGVAAQRLVRRLCAACKQLHKMTELEYHVLSEFLENDQDMIYQPTGCAACNQTGFTGRIGIYEIIPIDNQIQMMIHDNNKEHEILNYAYQHYTSMKQDGLTKVLQGYTTIEEVIRVCKEL